MKRWFYVIAMSVICLFLFTGCGSKMIKSGDDSSKYPYGWYENKDGTVTVEIGGKWDEECSWEPVYNALYFQVTEEKAIEQRFAVSGCSAGGGEIVFRLIRERQDLPEFEIRLSLASSPSGSVTILSNSHQEYFWENDYRQIPQADGSVVFSIRTPNISWNRRWHTEEITVERQYDSDDVDFSISAEKGYSGVIELYNETEPRKLELTVAADDNGVTTIIGVTENQSTDVGDALWQAFCENCGVTGLTLPGEIKSCDEYIWGELEKIPYKSCSFVYEGEEYELYIFSDGRLTELFELDTIEVDSIEVEDIWRNEKTLIPVQITRALLYDTMFTICEREDGCSATWQQQDNFLILRGSFELGTLLKTLELITK